MDWEGLTQNPTSDSTGASQTRSTSWPAHRHFRCRLKSNKYTVEGSASPLVASRLLPTLGRVCQSFPLSTPRASFIKKRMGREKKKLRWPTPNGHHLAQLSRLIIDDRWELPSPHSC